MHTDNHSTSAARIAALAQSIKENADVLAASLLADNIAVPCPRPSARGPGRFPLHHLRPQDLAARDALLALTSELHNLVLGPRDALKNHAWNSISYIALQAISEFQIAHAVPVHDGATISYSRLAARVHDLVGVTVPVTDLKALIRLAIADGLFAEPRPDRVAHSRASLLLAEDVGVASWVGLFTTDLLRPFACMVEAMRRWPASQEPNQTGVNIAYNNDAPFFQFIQSNEARQRRYLLAMKTHGARDGYDLSHTVDGYPWSKLGVATVVDIGGCQGHVAFAIAQANPHLTLIVQDKPHLRAAATVGAVPRALASRVTLTSHDCFDAQPVVGAAVYFFRHVLHAFSDRYAIEALRALVPALRRGARVLVNDHVLPRPGVLSVGDEKSARVMDVLMRAVCNARERDEDDWKALFAAADERFRWEGVTETCGKLSFIEAVWTG